ncbi:MAG: family 16 glycosylhydrolase [Fibrobacter sp.]|nr:family 16 glycosylhydrolase [Fibrobacter sp.]
MRNLSAHVVTVIYFIVLSVSPNAAQSSWNLIWSDEFNTAGLTDTQKWSYDTGGNGWGNNELQYYTANRIQNARIEDTTLIIETRKENYGINKYTSARLVSKNKGDWLYGRIEVRAKLPFGRGSWPAIWMLPTDWQYGGWPASGEIDIMEHVGYDQGVIHATVHTDSLNHIKGTQVGKSITIPDCSSAFHVYALEWYPDHIDVFVDSIKYFSFSNRNEGFRTWPFDKRFHILLNTAIGGNWGGAQGIDTTIVSTLFYIDYVRVYEENQTGPFTLSIENQPGGEVSFSPLKQLYNKGELITVTALAQDNYAFAGWSGTISSNANPLTFSISRNSILSPLFIIKGELVRNGRFDDLLKEWSEWSNTGTSAIRNVKDGIFEIRISEAGNNDWDLQLSQAGMNLVANRAYRFSFSAWAQSNRTITARVNMTKEPFSAWFLKEISLTSTPTVYTFDFIMPQPGDTNARVEFDFGKSTSTVYLDNISLIDIATTSSTFNNHTSTYQKNIIPGQPATLVIKPFSRKSSGGLYYDLSGKQIKSIDTRTPLSNGIYIRKKNHNTAF